MSVPIVKQTPTGKWQIYCPTCKASAVVPFRETARIDARKHVCPTRPGEPQA